MEAIFGAVPDSPLTQLHEVRKPTKAVFAPFHLGFPLDLCRIGSGATATYSGTAVFRDLVEEMACARFLPVSSECLAYDENVSVPMGHPLVTRDSAHRFGDGAECYIILFSTGLFLVVVLYFDARSLSELEDAHECDDSGGFSAYGRLEESGRAFGAHIREWSARKARMLAPLFTPNQKISLIDAYYLSLHDSSEPEDERIGYVNAAIPRDHGSVVLYTYASYYSMLWLHKALCRQIGDLKTSLLARRPAPRCMVENLKALSLHVRRLIAETNPFSIRITHDYVAALRCFRSAYEMEEIERAVVAQSELLEDAVAWFDAQAKERLNTRIGIAAIIISLISFSSVAAGLISTIDFANRQDAFTRVWLIVGGTLGAAALLAVGFAAAALRHKRTARN